MDKLKQFDALVTQFKGKVNLSFWEKLKVGFVISDILEIVKAYQEMVKDGIATDEEKLNFGSITLMPLFTRLNMKITYDEGKALITAGIIILKLIQRKG